MGRPKGTSKVAELYTQLVDQLTEDGYKGTQRAMRIVRELRTALEDKGFGFETKAPTNKTAAPAKAIEPKVKRGPGRPRKDTTVAVAAPTATTPVKRGPGRPRKVVAVATVTSDSTDTTPKRRVGRPRKSPVAVTADVSSTEGSIDDLIDSLDVENPTAEA